MALVMHEAFIHYVWQFQYIDKSALTTTAGERVVVIKTGNYNTNQGPDFSNAKVKIGDIEWAGHVEIHICSSDWNRHAHAQDLAYNNVVLHVVWKHDLDIKRADGSSIPTLELQNRVDAGLAKSYHRLVNSGLSIPCKKSFSAIPRVTQFSMMEKAVAQRLRAKSLVVLELLEKNKGDWEETFYQTLCRNFGFKVNADAFFQLARVIPYRLLQKQGGSLLQVEALLFGGAGMLEAKTKDEYLSALFQEYRLLQRKYNLAEEQMHYAQWKFLRLRPANFPTLRISQLAGILFTQKNILSRVLEITAWRDIREMFQSRSSAYWQSHYRFGSKATKAIEGIGKSSIENIVINSVVPLLAAYSHAKDDQQFMDKAI
ncbi:MAG: DUF2851 family protein, partial [Flammeovirgaceae bacterium]